MALMRALSLAILVLVAALAAGTAHATRPTWIVVDHATGEVIASDGADEQNYPASLTKMMTLYLTFEALRAGRLGLASSIRVSTHAAAQPPSKLGLRAGSKITVENAIQALAVKSANDIAVALGEALGGSEERFAQIMTRTARLKGLRSTTFRNASGLPDGDQMTTARDIATLAQRLITDFPQYYPYFSRPTFTYAGRTHGNHNRLMATYRGMDGLKTGFIRASGFNLAASAVRDGQRLVGVVLGGESTTQRNNLMARILDDAFQAPPPKGPLTPSVAVAQLQSPGSILQAKPMLAQVKTVPGKIPGSRAAAVEQGDADPGPFAVQIGAFAKRDLAIKMAGRAAVLAPKLTTGSQIDAPRVPGRTAYAARLTGLTRSGADRLCNELKRQKQSCFVVTP